MKPMHQIPAPRSQESRHFAVFVNVAKLTLLAALTPPVVVGIAQRATLLGHGIDAAAIVAGTMTTGAICAIIGALLFGRLCDIGAPTPRNRWRWVLLSTALGTAGLLWLALGHSQLALLAGWGIAQLGYSGAMAVLRAVLAAALPNHRRRGAVVLVLGAYGGLLLPLTILLLAPSRVWETTFALALVSLSVPLLFLLKPERREVLRLEERDLSVPVVSTDMHSQLRFPPWSLLLMQVAVSAVAAAFLSYHTLDLTQRSTEAGFPVRASVWILVAAVAGLLLAAIVLLLRPRYVARIRAVIFIGNSALALSLVIRAVADQPLLLSGGAALSGFAIGLLNSTLLAAAFEAAPRGRDGRFLGAFSAAGAGGQLLGPLLGLGLIAFVSQAAPNAFGGNTYQTMFLILAVIPLVLCFGVAAPQRR